MTDAFDRLARDLPTLGVSVTLTIRLHHNGAMSIEAPLGDKGLCLSMLDHARDAVLRQGGAQIVVPPCDVEVVRA